MRIGGMQAFSVFTCFLWDVELTSEHMKKKERKKKEGSHFLAHLPPSPTPAKEVVEKEDISVSSFKS